MIDAKDVPSPEQPEDAFAAVVALRTLDIAPQTLIEAAHTAIHAQ
ncbi:hypothetical protein [Embleya sp. NPDC020630]